MSRKRKILIIVFVFLFLLVTVSLIYDAKYPEEESTIQTTPTPTTSITSSPEPEECTLNAKVRSSDTQLEITNLSEVDWQDVKIEINSGIIRGGYSYIAQVIEAGATYTIGLARFSDSKGNRFNPFEKMVQNVYITESVTLCDFYAETK